MVVGRLRKTLKQSLAIALAAALMATSIPDFSVTAMAEETVSEENTSDKAASKETGEGAQDEESTDSVSTEQKEDTTGTQESNTEQHETENASETEHASDTESMTEREDKTESETETRTETETDTDDTTKSVEDEEESETEERLDKNADVEQGQEDVIYKNDFNNLETGKPLTDNEGEKGIIAELSNGNMAVVYDVDLSQPDKDDSPWSTAFQADLSLPDMYNVSSAEKLTMSYDVYIPTSNTDIGTLTAQAILRNGDRWEWKQANTMESYTNSNLVSGEIDGYSKISVSIEIIKGDDWKLKDITSLKAITAGLAGNPSSYKGKLYLDNVVLKDTSTKTETPEPEEPTTPVNEEVFMKTILTQ